MYWQSIVFYGFLVIFQGEWIKQLMEFIAERKMKANVSKILDEIIHNAVVNGKGKQNNEEIPDEGQGNHNKKNSEESIRKR